jgi:hypothetical protein
MEPRNVRDAFDEEFDNVTLADMKRMGEIIHGLGKARNARCGSSAASYQRTAPAVGVANKDVTGTRIAPAARAGSKSA